MNSSPVDERLAERIGEARSKRARIQAELDFNKGEADALSLKTASWGVERVDRAMIPILAKIEELQGL